MVFIDNKIFKQNTFSVNQLKQGEYEKCVFVNIDFTSADLQSFIFLETEFIGCNFSFVQLTQTSLLNVTFRDCKLVGTNFENCNGLGLKISFDNCLIRDCIFYKKNLQDTLFKDSELYGVDFAFCDLTNSVFDNCNLEGAIFGNTILNNVDFRTAYNFIIDPENNKIKKAKFSAANIIGLLHRYDIEIE